MTQPQKHTFKAETQKVLSILTHSLYTNREIFLRELLSNASDALEKLRFLQSKGENVRDPELPLEIRISIDSDKGILQIADTGLGMTEQELIDNLGTIARSGSETFLQDLETKSAPATDESGEQHTSKAASSSTSAAEIIGRFGIGFYSVFMVADSVDVVSLSALGDEPPHVWSSTGSGDFTVKALAGGEASSCRRGTVIRAKIKEGAKNSWKPIVCNPSSAAIRISCLFLSTLGRNGSTRPRPCGANLSFPLPNSSMRTFTPTSLTTPSRLWTSSIFP